MYVLYYLSLIISLFVSYIIANKTYLESLSISTVLLPSPLLSSLSLANKDVVVLMIVGLLCFTFLELMLMNCALVTLSKYLLRLQNGATEVGWEKWREAISLYTVHFRGLYLRPIHTAWLVWRIVRNCMINGRNQLAVLKSDGNSSSGYLGYFTGQTR